MTNTVTRKKTVWEKTYVEEEIKVVGEFIQALSFTRLPQAKAFVLETAVFGDVDLEEEGRKFFRAISENSSLRFTLGLVEAAKNWK